jgi:hypothetical protein
LPNRHLFAWWLFRQTIVHFSVAFSVDASDESSCAEQAQKRIPTHMTTAETTTTDKAAAVGAQGAHVAAEKALAKKAASQKKGAPKGPKSANGAKQGAKAKAALKKAGKPGAKGSNNAAKASGKSSAPRAESKGAKILEMIARSKGATLAEIMKATDWQAHSVRGFISTASKKHGVKTESAKNDAGERTYKIAK